jgi:hypothetical protein
MRAFFTRGLITPARMTRRYKPDALQLGGDAIPALPGPIGAPWVKAGDDDGFTVLLELDASHPGPIAQDPLSGLRLHSAPIPVSAVVAVHARSEAEAAEIRSRDYRNLDPSIIPLRVSPELFGESGPTEASLQDWIASQLPPDGVDDDSLAERECVAGAIAILLDGVARRDELVKNVAHVAAGLLAEATTVSPLSRLGELVREVGWIAAGRDARHFEVVARAITDQSGPEEPAPTELLDSIATGFHRGAPELDVEAPLAYIGAVVRGEREFTGFQGSSGDATLKSLLLFLLRPTAAETRTWFSEQLGLGDGERALALLWAGLSCRFSGVPSGQRGSRELQAVLQGWMCGVPQQEMATAEGGDALRFEAGGRQLVEWVLERPSLRARLLSGCAPDDPVAVRIAVAMGWDDCLETVIEADRAELTAARGRAIVRVQGRPRLTHLVHPEMFIDLLRSLSDRQVEEISAGTTAASPPKRTRKRTAK